MSRYYDYFFKIHVIGEPGVGKTSLLLRFTENTFSAAHIFPTTCLGFKIKTITLDNKRIKLQIWNGPGQGGLGPYCTSYYRQTSGLIFVYDVTDGKSFDQVPLTLSLIDEHSGVQPHKLLVGNKCDLVGERVIEYTTAKEFANSLNIPFIETSAKCSVNVELAFVMMASQIKIDFDSKIKVPSVPSVPLDPIDSVCLDKKAEIKKSRCCC